MKVKEPAVPYQSSYIQGLKNRLISSIDTTDDEVKLEQCLTILGSDDMPCVFTEEEFDEEIRLSETSEIATQEEISEMLARWKN